MKTLTWLPRWIWLVIWFIGQIITSSWAVLKDLATPGIDAHPGIARVRTDCATDAEVTMLSAMITITPGTLTLGTEQDADGVRWIYVHSLYDGDPASVAAGSIDMQNHILAAMRRTGFDPRTVDQTNRHHPRRATS
ncbi:Na+/H+ antiporter subunit E [Enteractinococcus coprophilus]|uniref:Multicomponent Na+:H+ antiporter subunit E n=1 Tax=Enteractinococcus coprophilus TaxID=1027633 RepID=A0A543AJ47_9MICC|nr:Na+/H+ antiporter subunit E [Enteractinococcus coprophilus]TQL72604.1 multicomponent Na+:H+ antiporter subunit E [Enteractinococcus coprophilus]